MSTPAIEISQLSKRYVIGNAPSKHDGLRHSIEAALRSPLHWLRGGRKKPATSEFWALRDVSFSIQPGEVVGIIGRNGAGKSTLLKVLSRITQPTSGRIQIHGRVASLLEVGTGFHAELTGRENIFLNGAILGMRRAEIKRKFDEIVEFAGVDKFLDTPVKRYSSGMYVRLAFAVAAHLEPEILIVDEVLAVGDSEFQRKCLRRMQDIATSEGRTILFVSHNMAAIQSLCSRCIVLRGGQVELQDSPERAVRFYTDTILPSAVAAGNLRTLSDRSGNGAVKLTEFRIEDLEGRPLPCATTGADVVFVFDFAITGLEFPEKVDVGMSIATEAEQMLSVFYSSYSGRYLDPDSRTGSFRCRVSKLPLAAGRYIVGARVVVNGDESDWPRGGVGHLDVEHGNFYGTSSTGFTGRAPFLLAGQWSVAGEGDACIPAGIESNRR